MAAPSGCRLWFVDPGLDGWRVRVAPSWTAVMPESLLRFVRDGVRRRLDRGAAVSEAGAADRETAVG